jgi:succinyl-CoA synthetase beta subunit
MDLLEYQAKELFRQVGIPVLPSQKINNSQELKKLKIPYPIVLKSQVHAGGRSKLGGIKFASNTIDAVAATQAIFHLCIQGEYPEVVLAEAKYNPDRELYLAIVLDRAARRPILLGSTQGGIDVELAREQMQQAIVSEHFSPFYARRLALKMGLKGEAIEAVSHVIENMYHLFAQYDLDLIEINPLGLRASGEVMALDGKVTVNDDALGRHDRLLTALTNSRTSKKAPSVRPKSQFDPIELDDPDGEIAIICNGAGLTMATLDLVYQLGGQPASFLNIGNETPTPNTPTTLCDRLEQGLLQITKSDRVSVILINILGNTLENEALLDAIERYLDRVGDFPDVVIRWTNTDSDAVIRRWADRPQISVATHLEEAVARAIAVAN